MAKMNIVLKFNLSSERDELIHKVKGKGELVISKKFNFLFSSFRSSLKWTYSLVLVENTIQENQSLTPIWRIIFLRLPTISR